MMSLISFAVALCLIKLITYKVRIILQSIREYLKGRVMSLTVHKKTYEIQALLPGSKPSCY